MDALVLPFLALSALALIVYSAWATYRKEGKPKRPRHKGR